MTAKRGSVIYEEDGQKVTAPKAVCPLCEAGCIKINAWSTLECWPYAGNKNKLPRPGDDDIKRYSKCLFYRYGALAHSMSFVTPRTLRGHVEEDMSEVGLHWDHGQDLPRLERALKKEAIRFERLYGD